MQIRLTLCLQIHAALCSVLCRQEVHSGARTPFVVRTSKDGKTWGLPIVIEEDKERGYCYPAVFFTKDNSMLCGYCRGGKEDPNWLARLGIMKIGLDEME